MEEETHPPLKEEAWMRLPLSGAQRPFFSGVLNQLKEWMVLCMQFTRNYFRCTKKIRIDLLIQSNIGRTLTFCFYKWVNNACAWKRKQFNSTPYSLFHISDWTGSSEAFFISNCNHINMKCVVVQAAVVNSNCLLEKWKWLTCEYKVMITQAINKNPDWSATRKLHVVHSLPFLFKSKMTHTHAIFCLIGNFIQTISVFWLAMA